MADNEVANSGQGQLTVVKAGRRGGIATRTRFRGTNFYQRIGAMGGRRTATLYRDLLAEFGKRGGRPRRPALNKPEGEEGH